jgi:ATP-dependent DNA helicase RecG
MPGSIPKNESLTIEFKSDRQCLPDRELVAAVVALANTDGGDLYLGIEDDGTPTGLHRNHQDVSGTAALIANRTSPPLYVTVEVMDGGAGVKVTRITVPKCRELVATSDGLLQRRRLLPSGKPEAVPFYPHEFAQRQAALGRLDQSALPVPGAAMGDLDPLERERLRQMVERYHGDAPLLELTDQELDAALGLITRQNGKWVPTLAGLLLIGKEGALRQMVPAHEVAFQVLQGTAVKVNDFYRTPLLRTFEVIEERFKARVEEEELDIGMFRVPAPNFERLAFREAFVNALVHRDYARLGAIHVRIEDERLIVSNPGGFVEGVTLANFLVVEPRPRNPLLADAVKRIGLAERTGRGVDRIFEGVLRSGHPAPDYSRSDAVGVAVAFTGGKADLEFLRLAVEHERRTNSALSLDALIMLRRLRAGRRLTIGELAAAIQRDEEWTRAVVAELVEVGLLAAHGATRSRAYTLSPALYRAEGKPAGFVRQAVFDRLQQEQMVLTYARAHARIRCRDAMELCRLTRYQASKLLSHLARKGFLILRGGGRASCYESAEVGK